MRKLGVVFAQLIAKAAGIYTHDGIGRTIEGSTLRVQLAPQRLFFQAGGMTVECLLHYEAKERAEAVRAGEDLAREHPHQLCAHQRGIHFSYFTSVRAKRTALPGRR